MSLLWMFFDMAGTLAFALSGALVGISRRMDALGVLVLALCTAIGGGIIRDMMVGNVPPMSLRSGLYVGVTILMTAGLFVVYRRTTMRKKLVKPFRFLYLLTDTIGLAAFTVTGASVGFSHPTEGPALTVLLGVITAVGGGIVRDVLAQRIPSVLREEVYAFPTIIGGLVFYYIALTDNREWAGYMAFAIVFIIRSLAIRYKWSLPKFHR